MKDVMCKEWQVKIALRLGSGKKTIVLTVKVFLNFPYAAEVGLQIFHLS